MSKMKRVFRITEGPVKIAPDFSTIDPGDPLVPEVPPEAPPDMEPGEEPLPPPEEEGDPGDVPSFDQWARGPRPPWLPPHLPWPPPGMHEVFRVGEAEEDEFGWLGDEPAARGHIAARFGADQPAPAPGAEEPKKSSASDRFARLGDHPPAEPRPEPEMEPEPEELPPMGGPEGFDFTRPPDPRDARATDAWMRAMQTAPRPRWLPPGAPWPPPMDPDLKRKQPAQQKQQAGRKK